MQHSNLEQERLSYLQTLPMKYRWLADCGYTVAELLHLYGHITRLDGAEVWRELCYLCMTMKGHSHGSNYVQYKKVSLQNTSNRLPTVRAYYSLHQHKVRVTTSLLSLKTMLQPYVLPTQDTARLVYSGRKHLWHTLVPLLAIETSLYGLIPIEPVVEVRMDYVRLYLLLRRLELSLPN